MNCGDTVASTGLSIRKKACSVAALRVLWTTMIEHLSTIFYIQGFPCRELTCVCVCVCVCVRARTHVCRNAKFLQSCLTLRNPLDCSPPDSSVHGILQARILEYLSCPPPGDLPNPGRKLVQPALISSTAEKATETRESLPFDLFRWHWLWWSLSLNSLPRGSGCWSLFPWAWEILWGWMGETWRRPNNLFYWNQIHGFGKLVFSEVFLLMSGPTVRTSDKRGITVLVYLLLFL